MAPALKYESCVRQTFVRQILTELAKSSFYYFNNTKEFAATHPVYKGANWLNRYWLYNYIRLLQTQF